MEELKYTSDNLFDIECLKIRCQDEIKKLTTEQKVIEGKKEILYEIEAAIEAHINSIKQQQDGKAVR